MADPRENRKLPFMIQYLFIDEPLEFIAFIENMFDAKELRERAVVDGKVNNALFEISGSMYEISQARDEFKQVVKSFHLYTDKHAEIVEKGKKNNCEIKYARTKMMEYGDEESWMIDPFGNNWFIATPLD